MKTLILALTIVFATVLSANAEDSPQWAGPYGGVYALWNSVSADFSDPYDGHIGERMDRRSNDAFDNFGGGVKGGYLFQTGSFVYGAEGYFEYDSMSGCFVTHESGAMGCPYGHSIELEQEYSFGINGKLGKAMGPTLLYGLVGANVAEVKSTYNDWTWSGSDGDYDPDGGDTIDRSSASIWGVRVGGGAEHRFTPSVSGFIEISKTFYEDNSFYAKNVSNEDDGDTGLSTDDLENITLSFGFNWWF